MTLVHFILFFSSIYTATNELYHLNVTYDSPIEININSVLRQYEREVHVKWKLNVPNNSKLKIDILEDNIDSKRDSLIIEDSLGLWNVCRNFQKSLLPTKLFVTGDSSVVISLDVNPVLAWKRFAIQMTLLHITGESV